MHFFKSIKVFILFLCIASQLVAQDTTQPFYQEIRAFKKQYSINPPPKDAILFVGSSSFRMWKNLQEMFPGYTVINRGFGGSTLPDVQLYAADIIYPYLPKQIVIFCGENDVATGTVDSKAVTERFKSLFREIRRNLPGRPIVFVSMKPSPSREKYLAVLRQGNQMIKNFLYQQQNVGYVDIFTPMLDEAGKPRPELFLPDMLHMNQKGYDIWQKAIQPYLIKD